MINKNQKTPEFEIKPQWVSVKEEIVNDFFNLADSFASYSENPSHSDLKRGWICTLKGLYIKIRLKIKNNEKYNDLVEKMDKYVYGLQPVSLQQQMEFTRQICEFIEEIGLTKVEQEKIDPFENFEQTSYP
jgi:hypothetical protein